MLNLKDTLTKIDALYPNNFETSVKVDFISELDSIIRCRVKKLYEIKTLYSTDGYFKLPPYIFFENIEFVIVNEKKLYKTDLSNYKDGFYILPRATKAKVVYLSLKPSYRIAELTLASPFLGEDYIMFSEKNPFFLGDVIKLGDMGSYEIKKIETNGDGQTLLYLEGAEFDEGFYEGTLLLEKENILELFAPFDNMYTYYVCSKIDFFNRDITSYNNHLLLFNESFKEYEKYYKERAPKKNSKFKNFW